jgi:hypothetical protein
VFPKGFQRVRYYGGQAPKPCATITRLMQEALVKIQGSIKGAVQSIAARTERERYHQRTGRDPRLGPHCHHAMELWKLGHPV